MDNLIICNHCGGDACYVDEVNAEIKTYFCYGCGFQTNSLMKVGEKFYEEQLQVLPELYKDLMMEDDEKKIWMPSAINIPEKGMVFANGNNTDNWMWSAVKAIPVTEEEKSKYPIPGQPGKYYEWRMDMTTMKQFPERGFMDALSYIELLPE